MNKSKATRKVFTVVTALVSILWLNACTTTQNNTSAIAGITSRVSEPKLVKLAQGNMLIEDSGLGTKTIICIPGMGDTRGQFRQLAPMLIKQGHRVIVMDPRGQGDSDASFDTYTASAVGKDLVTLIDTTADGVYLIGNSSGGASAAWAAAERPDKVKGVVFLDAFLRDHRMGFFQTLGLNLALRGPWATSAWISYYKSLFTGNPPSDQEAYTDALGESMNQDGHIEALREMAFASKSDVEARLKQVKQPVLAIAGTKDPDFEHPEAEINWILTQMTGEKAMIANAGHYPHLEYADQVTKLVTKFINAH